MDENKLKDELIAKLSSNVDTTVLQMVDTALASVLSDYEVAKRNTQLSTGVLRFSKSRRQTRMNKEEKIAFEWAKKQNYQSVAARYARILADYIDHVNGLLESAAEEIENTYGQETELSEQIRDALN